MKAIVWTKYGGPEILQLRDVEKPVPKANEILIKIKATTVTLGDCELRCMKFPLLMAFVMRIWRGLLKPRGTSILGSEIAGVIEEIGNSVELFKAGDQVFGSTGMKFGANAEYICIPEKPGELEGGVTLKPANMSLDEASTLPFGGRDALHFLRKGSIQPGQKILINGAGGTIGTFGVQLSKYFGAEVTAVDSTEKLEMLKSIGADYCIDYTKEDFTKNGELYDIIFDVVGKVSFWHSRNSLKPDGCYLLANPLKQIFKGLWIRISSRKKVIMEAANGSVEDLIFLKTLVEAGQLKSVIDKRYPLEQIVEAHRYVDTGQKKGNVVITIEH